MRTVIQATLPDAAIGSALIGCSEGSTESGGSSGPTGVDSAGVTIVQNEGVDRPLAWRMEPVLRLGGTDEGPEAFFHIREATVGADVAGRLYILDIGNFQVVRPRRGAPVVGAP